MSKSDLPTLFRAILDEEEFRVQQDLRQVMSAADVDQRRASFLRGSLQCIDNARLNASLRCLQEIRLEVLDRIDESSQAEYDFEDENLTYFWFVGWYVTLEHIIEQMQSLTRYVRHNNHG